MCDGEGGASPPPPRQSAEFLYVRGHAHRGARTGALAGEEGVSQVWSQWSLGCHPLPTFLSS